MYARKKTGPRPIPIRDVHDRRALAPVHAQADATVRPPHRGAAGLTAAALLVLAAASAACTTGANTAGGTVPVANETAPVANASAPVVPTECPRLGGAPPVATPATAIQPNPNPPPMPGGLAAPPRD